MEFAWRLPIGMKMCEKTGKWLLRKIMYQYIPNDLIERPKMGFGIPVWQWLYGPLRDWAEALLEQSRLANEGYFHPAPIREK